MELQTGDQWDRVAGSKSPCATRGGSSAQQNASCLSNTMSRTTCKMITPLPTIWKREEKSKEESSEAV
jgi:hypothetical protein